MKQLDVLFVHPNGAPIIYQELSNSYSAIEPPIWAGLLAKNALKNGFSAQILDCEAERIGAEESAIRVKVYNPRLVAIVVYGQQPSASTQNMIGARLLIEKLNEEAPELKNPLDRTSPISRRPSDLRYRRVGLCLPR